MENFRRGDGPKPGDVLGTNAYDRVEILTAITGRQAEVRTIPGDDHELVEQIFNKKIAVDKPVLVGSRPLDDGEQVLPHGLEDSPSSADLRMNSTRRSPRSQG